jgi:hypothetical protein
VLSFSGLTPQMQLYDRTAQSLGQVRTMGSVGGRISGPIRLNRLFYNTSFQFNRTTRPLRSILTADELALSAAGISADSVARLQAILFSLGMPASLPRLSERMSNDQGSLFGQFDFLPSAATSQSWQLSLRGNWGRTTPTGGAGLTTTPSTGAESRQWSGTVGLRHQGYIRGVFLSTANVAYTANESRSDPYLSLPAARVRLASELDDGVHVAFVSVGASLGIASSSTRDMVQLRHQLRWSSMSGSQTFAIASDVRRESSRSDPSGNLLGSFTFNSSTTNAFRLGKWKGRSYRTLENHEPMGV